VCVDDCGQAAVQQGLSIHQADLVMPGQLVKPWHAVLAFAFLQGFCGCPLAAESLVSASRVCAAFVSLYAPS